MRVSRGDRVQTHNGTPATVHSVKKKKPNDKSKSREIIVIFDCSRKKWPIRENELIPLDCEIVK